MSYSFRGHVKTVVLLTNSSIFNHGLFNINPVHEQILQHSSYTLYIYQLLIYMVTVTEI